MKKYTVFVIAMALVLSSSPVWAENGDLRPDREAIKAMMEAKKEEFKQRMDTERDAFKEALRVKRETFRAEIATQKEEFRNAARERKLEFWNGAKRMIGERFTAAIRNLERIQARVGEVIEKLNTEGKDTVVATEYLDLSKEKLEEAKIKIEEIKTLIPPNGETVTPEIFEQIKLKAREAKDLLKESHRALVNAIREIKGLNSGPNDSETQS